MVDVELTESGYRVAYGDLAKSTRWRRFVDDLRGSDGSVLPRELSRSASNYVDPVEWLESLTLGHELSMACSREQDKRWMDYCRSSLGPAPCSRPVQLIDRDPSTSRLVALATALGIDALVDPFEIERRVLMSQWWQSVTAEYNRGDVRSTDGPKDRKKELD